MPILQCDAIAKAANTATELQQMQEILDQRNLMCADPVADNLINDDNAEGFELVQSKKTQSEPKQKRRNDGQEPLPLRAITGMGTGMGTRVDSPTPIKDFVPTQVRKEQG